MNRARMFAAPFNKKRRLPAGELAGDAGRSRQAGLRESSRPGLDHRHLLADQKADNLPCLSLTGGEPLHPRWDIYLNDRPEVSRCRHGDNRMKTERRALLLSAAAALLVGGVGVTIALISNSRAILLDGMFNLTYFLVALVSVRVARLAQRPDDEAFPRGYSYFESLINAGKGLLILGVSAVALVDSLAALVTGGREILAGLAITYAAFATMACSVTTLLLYAIWRREPTPLVRADLENWLVNSVISAAVLLAFALIPLARSRGFAGITPYIDPVLVAAVVILCIGVPLRMAWRGIMELLDRAPPEHVTRPLRKAVDDVLAPLPVQKLYVRIVRPGRTVFVAAHIVLPDDFPVERLSRLDQIRQQMDAALRRLEPRLVTDVLFTADERWALPTSGAHESHYPGKEAE